MALKRKITKAEYEALPEHFKKEYKPQGEEFFLEVEGEDDRDALKRAKDHEKNARQEVEQKLRQETEKAVRLQEEVDQMRRGAIPKSDVEGLEASWKQKVEAKETELKGELGKRDAVIAKITVDSKARELATKISTTPDLLIPHIRSRLNVEIAGEEAHIRVLDGFGKPSASTLDDLAKEFQTNAAFASVMIGSNASGGGANGGNGGGGATNKKLADMTEQERVSLYKANPDEFNRLVKETQK